MTKFPIYKHNKRMLKAKNLIKNAPSRCILYVNVEAYQTPRQTSKTEISAKAAKNLQSSTVFLQEAPSQTSDRVPNTCY